MLSNTSSFIFFAGLDGTGHHFVADMLEQCPHCRDAAELRRSLIPWWYRDHTTNEKRDWQQRIVALFQKHAQMPAQRPHTVWCLNTLGEDTTGMLSYPNSANARFMPRVDWLAAAAQEARVPLHVVTLLRDAVPLEASVRNRFQKNYAVRWGKVDAAHPVAAAMLAQAVALSGQLRTLDPAQLLCLDYETLPHGAAALDRVLCKGGVCAGWSLPGAASSAYIPSTRSRKVRMLSSTESGSIEPYLQPLQRANLQLIQTCKARAASVKRTGAPPLSLTHSILRASLQHILPAAEPPNPPQRPQQLRHRQLQERRGVPLSGTASANSGG